MVISSPWPLNKDAKCHDEVKSATPSLEQGEHTHLQREEVSVTPSWTCGWLNCKVLLPHLLLVLAGTSHLLLLLLLRFCQCSMRDIISCIEHCSIRVYEPPSSELVTVFDTKVLWRLDLE